MTPQARIWFAHYLTPFRTDTLYNYLRRVRADRLDRAYSPLMDLAASADGLTGQELVTHAHRCCTQANELYWADHPNKMNAMEWLMEFDLARVNGTEAAFMAAVAEVVEAELRRRNDPLGVGRASSN